MGHSGENSEDPNAGTNVVKARPTRYQRETNSMGNWARGHSYYILTKNLRLNPIFLICLMEEISLTV